MVTVNHVLKVKGNAIWGIEPEATVFDALHLLAEKDIGAVLVVKEGKLVGIFSERDYARKIVLKGKSSTDTPVHEVMTDQVITIQSDHSVTDCMALMTNAHIRHLPVYQSDQLIGVISIGDVVKAIISEQEFVIEQLEKYIAGR